MRIAIANWSKRQVGGVETYLNTVIPALAGAGHDIALLCEVDEPVNRARIELAEGALSWCVTEIGGQQAITELRAWRPDVIYAHKFADPDLEVAIQMIGPSVFFSHDYYGTCISGLKTFKRPVVEPCDRRFGALCLFHYLPRGCGGHSPLTMVNLYRLQARRLESLKRYDAVITHSEHMLRELLRHGLEAYRVRSFPCQIKAGTVGEANDAELRQFASSPADPRCWHLLFSARMEKLKGGHVFLQALPEVIAASDRPVHVTFAGDGRERASLEEMASKLSARHANLQIEFTGWLSPEQIESLLARCDLLVVPSLWPEPFGLVGPEAGLRGVPVAAFAVGGITDWLKEGINGALAPGHPATPAGLTQAILRCLGSPLHHEQLRRGAVRMAGQFNIGDHLNSLLELLTAAIAHAQLKNKL